MIWFPPDSLPVVQGSRRIGSDAQGAQTVKEPLRDYVRRIRNEHRLSLLDVERNSRRSGWFVTGSYVSKIENGSARNPSLDKLIGLAYGMGVPLEELLTIAVGKPLSEPEAQEIRLVVMFRELPEDRREDIMQMVRVMHKQHAIKPAEVKSIDAKKRKPRAA